MNCLLLSQTGITFVDMSWDTLESIQDNAIKAGKGAVIRVTVLNQGTEVEYSVWVRPHLVLIKLEDFRHG